MLQTINASLQVGSTGKPASSGLLQNQLDRYKTQLADWCSCPGGKTPDGKKKIAEIEGKADAVKAQLQQMELARTRQAEAVKPDPLQSSRMQQDATLGSRVDVMA